MKLKYDESIPDWLHRRANSLIDRPVDLTNGKIHVTQLLQPAHMLRLQDEHWSELETSPDDLIPAMMGTAWHQYLEGAMSNGASEQRIEMQFGDWTICGTPDWFNHDTLIDFKTAKVWSKVFGKPEWEQQLNIYRWMLHTTMGLEISTVQVHAVYMDWTKNGALRSPEHPRKRWEVIDVPIWNDEQARAFVMDRLEAIETLAPFDSCSKEERWERGEKFAVMKPGRKSALRLFEDEESANSFACTNSPSGALTVEHRPGVPVRCLDWCSVRQFCPFGKGLSDE